MSSRATALLILAGPVVVLALGIAVMRGRPPKPPPPIAAGALGGANIVLITVDGLRADHLGVYASTGTLTPAIDRFAKEGIVFDRTYSHVPVAQPSHRTVMTGAYPNRLDATTTLAARLKAAGYRTAAFVGSADLNAQAGLADGFDHYDDRMPDGSSRNAEAVFTAARDWLVSSSQPPASSPYFVWTHLSDPNTPYAPPEPFRSQHESEGYDGEIAYVNATFLAFVTELRRVAALDRALIVLTAPYGESLGEHGEVGHGALAYDATLRVPLIMWSTPQIGPGMFRDTMRLVDVAPTILDLVGAATLPAVDGRSVRPFVGGDQRFDERESYFAVNAITGIVFGRRKLIRGRTPEFYDLASDPGEERNLYQENDPAVRELHEILDRVAAR